MSILDQISAAMDACLEAEEMVGLLDLPHEAREWRAWEKARALLEEAAWAAAEEGAVAASRCAEYAKEQGFKECGVCRKWKPEDELTEESAGYESKKGESSRSKWYRCQGCQEPCQSLPGP